MRVYVLRFALLFAFLLQRLDLSTAQHQSQSVKFSFSEDACHSGNFEWDGFKPPLLIRRNENTTKCAAGMGVEPCAQLGTISNTTDSYHLQSSQPLINILQQLKNSMNDTITIGLWVQVTKPDMGMQTGPILTIGRAGNETMDEGGGGHQIITECDQKQVDFALSIGQGNFVDLLYRTNDPYFEPCVRVRALALQDGLNHIAVVLGDGYQQVFINGKPSIRRGDQFNLQRWKESSFLYLFSFPGHDDYPAWPGQILQLSIGTQLWNANDVVAEIAMGIPDAEPIAKSMVHTMMEDAQMILNVEPSHDNSSSAALQLPVEYLNDDVLALLQSFNVTQQALQRLQDLKYYIVQYPSRGTLYQVADGTPVEMEMMGDAPTAIRGRNLFYVPPHNEHSEIQGSTYDFFEYCVSKTAIFALSQCQSFGTVDIVVDSVNDPPIALLMVEQQPYLVHEGMYEESKGLWLGGRDVDRNDGITKIQITKPPQHGFLYLSVPTPRADGLVHGTRLEDLDNTISTEEVFVEYRYAGGSDQTVQSTMAHDSFLFRVRDRNEAWSEEVQAEIRILSSLSTGKPTEFYAVDQEPLTLWIEGQDESGLDRPIGYFFEALPQESHGTLLDERSKPIQINRLISPRAGAAGLNLTFQSSPSVCPDPVVATVTATFAYRVVALSSTNTVESVSSVMVHSIQVKCAIEPLRLSIDNETVYNIETFSNPPDDPCSGYMYNATNTTNCSSAAIISSIKVVASKRPNNDRVLVSIEASEGFLTLDRNQRHRISAVGGPVEMRQTIQFLALEKDLNEILSNLHYQTETPGSHTIQITAKSCQGEVFESKDCHELTAFISIHAVEPHVEAPEKLYTRFPWFSLSFILTMLFLFKSKGKMRETLDEWKDEHDGTYQWKEHHDASTGYYFYESVEDGRVTWRAPLHESILPSPARFPNGSQPVPVHPTEYQWKEHFDVSTGCYYYENVEDGRVTWRAPLHESILPSPDRFPVHAAEENDDSQSLGSVSLTEPCDSDDDYSLDDVSIHSIYSIA